MREHDPGLKLLLLLLPATFRERHGEELLALLERMRADLGPSPGLFRLLRFYGAVTWDMVRPRFAFRPDAGAAGGGLRSTPDGRWSGDLGGDIRFAIRQYRRRWGTTVTMLGILSVGMAIAILLFSVVHSYAVRRPPGIAGVDDLVRIRGSQVTPRGLSVRNFHDEELEGYRGLTDQFSAVAGWADSRVVLDVRRSSRRGPRPRGEPACPKIAS